LLQIALEVLRGTPVLPVVEERHGGAEQRGLGRGAARITGDDVIVDAQRVVRCVEEQGQHRGLLQLCLAAHLGVLGHLRGGVEGLDRLEILADVDQILAVVQIPAGHEGRGECGRLRRGSARECQRGERHCAGADERERAPPKPQADRLLRTRGRRLNQRRAGRPRSQGVHVVDG
jgi:hypothetical protein